jgi:hypothetical protein
MKEDQMSALAKVLLSDNYKPPKELVESNERKLAAAKEEMGAKWIFHKDYVYTPKHRMMP